MASQFIWYIRETFKKVWVRVVGFAILAILAAVLARMLSPYLPESIALHTGAEAVSQLLEILTSSMLAVTIFSLSIAVSAFTVASDTATPRAAVLLQEDRTTQNVLSSFLGAFLFGLVGLIALYAKFYDASGKVVVFFFTVAVIAQVVIMLIRWISHLMLFGRMKDTLNRVEKAATDALQQHIDNPYLNGQQLLDTPLEGCSRIMSKSTGYVQNIDMKALQKCAKTHDLTLYIQRLPGAPVTSNTSLILVQSTGDIKEKAVKQIRSAFTIGGQRTFEHDPRFGLIVLTEIASRALSPAVNDPGTAIDILWRHVRIISQLQNTRTPKVTFDRVFVPPIKLQDIVEDAFRPIARDGASMLEVQIKLQKALASLCQVAPTIFMQPCQQMAYEAHERAKAASLLPAELAIIHSKMAKFT